MKFPTEGVSMDETTKQPIPKEQPRLWLNIKQLAEYLAVSKSTVERFKSEYGLPFSKVAQTTRFNRDVVDKWLLEHERKNVA